MHMHKIKQNNICIFAHPQNCSFFIKEKKKTARPQTSE